MKFYKFFLLFLLFLAGEIFAHQTSYPEFKDYGTLGGDFSLQSTLGKKIRLSDYKASLVLIYFGFTSCPDICSLTLSVAAKAIAKLERKQQKKIQLFFVTVDTKKDSLKMLSQYLAQFNKDFIGLKGTPQETQEVITAYGGYFFKADDSSIQVNHTGYLYLLDNKQKIRALYRSDVTIPQLYSGLQKLLK